MAKRKRKERQGPDVSAFSDIAFLLIIFFIVVSSLAQISGIVTEIPSGEKAEEKSDDEPVTIKLRHSTIMYKDELVDMRELRARLASLNLDKKEGDAKVILLEAAGGVTYQNYFDVMASISAAGGVTAILQEAD